MIGSKLLNLSRSNPRYKVADVAECSGSTCLFDGSCSSILTGHQQTIASCADA